MKRVLIRITAAIFTAGTLGACGPQFDSAQETSEIRVLAPMNNSQGQYSLNFLDLKGIQDLSTLTGKFARFFMSPRIVEGRLEGAAPKARFIRNSNGNYVPTNEITQQLVTVYAHMQKLAMLDEELGAVGVNSWPRDIGVAVRVRGGLKNNAFYDGETDSMLFVPYNQAGLPIAINGGILAHEHFHSLFYKLSLPDSLLKASFETREEFLRIIEGEDLGAHERRPIPIVVGGEDIDPTSLRDYYYVVMTRALNEGLADFWGWMYTGDPDFIAQSLPIQGATRSLKARKEEPVNSLPSQGTIERSLHVFYNTGSPEKMKDYAVGYAYSLATQFSRVLKRFTEIHAKAHGIESLAARKEVAKMIVKTLPQIKTKFEALDQEVYTSAHFLNSFGQQIKSMKQEECVYLAEVLNNSEDLTNSKYVCHEDSSWKLVKQELAEQVKEQSLSLTSETK